MTRLGLEVKGQNAVSATSSDDNSNLAVSFTSRGLCVRVEMGQVAPAGEPVRLRDELRDDWQGRVGVHAGARARGRGRDAPDGRVRLDDQRRQHRPSPQPHPAELQTGPASQMQGIIDVKLRAGVKIPGWTH